ncbi:MAG: ROK family protein [Planctomycetota bacterium]
MSQTSIVQPRLLSRLNERLVLHAIQAKGPSTRAELTDEIGVTFATVAKAVSSLLQAQLLEEFDELTVGRGRPAKRLRLAVDESQVIGVAIEVDEVLVAAAGLDGEPRTTAEVLSTPSTYPELVNAIRQAVESLSTHEHPKTLGIGVSVAAQIDESAGRVAVAANLPYLSGKPLQADLSEALGIPCSIIRDTHAVCVSERLRGAAKNLDNFLVLHLGVGIGVGVMMGGQIFFGQYGYAGELGHTTAVTDGELCHCGRRGCLETLASEWALSGRLSSRLGRRVNVDDIARLYLSGDPTTRQEVHEACRQLALGVSHAVHLFNPGKVIVYSRLFRACPELLLVLVHYIEETTLPLSYQGCEFVNATTTPLDGSIARVISNLTDSLAPRLLREERHQAT